MASEFDPGKSAANVLRSGRADLPLSAADDFDFTRAIVRRDTRNHPKTGKPYPEPRYQAIGKVRGKLVFLVFTPKPAPAGFRTISLRTANKKERKQWRDQFEK